MSGLPWFRQFTSDRTDQRLAVLTGDQYRVWHRLYCLAAEQPERGSVVLEDFDLLALEVSGGDEELLRATLARLEKLKLISRGGLQVTFTNWAERQEQVPSSTKEARRHRQAEHRKRLAEAPAAYHVTADVTENCDIVTGGHSDVTANVTTVDKIRVDQSRSRPDQDLGIPTPVDPPSPVLAPEDSVVLSTEHLEPEAAPTPEPTPIRRPFTSADLDIREGDLSPRLRAQLRQHDHVKDVPLPVAANITPEHPPLPLAELITLYESQLGISPSAAERRVLNGPRYTRLNPTAEEVRGAFARVEDERDDLQDQSYAERASRLIALQRDGHLDANYQPRFRTYRAV